MANTALPPSSPWAGLIGSPAPAVMQCLAVPAGKAYWPVWQVRTVIVEGRSRLAIQDSGPCSVTTKSLEMKIPDGHCLKLTAVDSRIVATHPSLEAQADAISRLGPGARFIFEGHVKLLYHHRGQHAEVTAERVLVDLADGHVEIAPVADSDRHLHLFGEVIGFSR
jgi:hypothetical protein